MGINWKNGLGKLFLESHADKINRVRQKMTPLLQNEINIKYIFINPGINYKSLNQLQCLICKDFCYSELWTLTNIFTSVGVFKWQIQAVLAE